MEIKFWGAKLTKPDVQADFSKGESCICMSSPRDKEYEQRLCKECMANPSFWIHSPKAPKDPMDMGHNLNKNVDRKSTEKANLSTTEVLRV